MCEIVVFLVRKGPYTTFNIGKIRKIWEMKGKIQKTWAMTRKKVIYTIRHSEFRFELFDLDTANIGRVFSYNFGPFRIEAISLGLDDLWSILSRGSR